MSGQTLGIVLSFDVPMASDNSEGDLTVIKSPSDIDSPYNFTQDTMVSYIFCDAGGNCVECEFSVKIEGMFSSLKPEHTFGKMFVNASVRIKKYVQLALLCH